MSRFACKNAVEKRSLEYTQSSLDDALEINEKNAVFALRICVFCAKTSIFVLFLRLFEGVIARSFVPAYPGHNGNPRHI